MPAAPLLSSQQGPLARLPGSPLLCTAHLVLLGSWLLFFKLDPLWKQGGSMEKQSHQKGAKQKSLGNTCLAGVGNQSGS